MFIYMCVCVCVKERDTAADAHIHKFPRSISQNMLNTLITNVRRKENTKAWSSDVFVKSVDKEGAGGKWVEGCLDALPAGCHLLC